MCNCALWLHGFSPSAILTWWQRVCVGEFLLFSSSEKKNTTHACPSSHLQRRRELSWGHQSCLDQCDLDSTRFLDIQLTSALVTRSPLYPHTQNFLISGGNFNTIESNFRHSSTINSKTDSLEISLLLVFPPQQVETDRQQSLDDWIERKLILTLVSKPNHQFIKRGNKSFNSILKT